MDTMVSFDIQPKQNDGAMVSTFASYQAFLKSDKVQNREFDTGLSEKETEEALFRTINVCTKHFLYDLNMKNYESNSVVLKAGRGILDLSDDVWADQPIFLVASGPSLNKNINQLSRVSGKWPIVVADATLPMMLAVGIEPDLAFVIDTKSTQARFFNGYNKSTKTKLCCVSCVHPATIAAWPGEVLFFNSIANEEDEATQLKYGQDFGSIGVGGNVSSAMLWFAMAFTMSSPVVFIGHDFSYPTIEQYYANNGVNALIPRHKKRFPTWDIFGNTVYTDLSLKSYKIWTENTMKDYTDNIEKLNGESGSEYSIRFINATEGGTLGTTNRPGALKKFIEYKKLSEVIDELEASSARQVA